MIYTLKTDTKCANACIFCECLKRKSTKKKSLADIKEELKKAKQKGYGKIRIACNVEYRNDFLKILNIAKNLNFEIILETGGRIFAFPQNFEKVDSYIDKYEFYFYTTNHYLAMKINDSENGSYEQAILGLKNIVKNIRKESKLTVKIVVLNLNIKELRFIIDALAFYGVKNIKFIFPFKGSSVDSVPSISWASGLLGKALKYAEQNAMRVVLGDELEYNPYFEDIQDYLDTGSAELKIDKKINKEKPHFSIIIPTYNKSESLKYVIESFLDQEYEKKDYEIIIVDDGSTDNTFEMVKKIKPACNLKYIYWPRKKGGKKDKYLEYAKFYNRAGTVRNIGLEHSAGNIILFNDADILVEKFCIKNHNEYHLENDRMIVRGFRMFLADDFKPDKKNVKDFEELKKRAEAELAIKKREQNCRYYSMRDEGWDKIITANLSIRKKNIDLAGAFCNDSPFWGYEDVEFGYRLKLQDMKLVWSDRIKVFHLPHENQSGDTYNTMATFWINTNIFYRKYLDSEIHDLFRSVVINRLDKKVFNY